MVIAGVLGLFLLGGFLAHHYYAPVSTRRRSSTTPETSLAREGRIGEAVEQFRSALSLTHGDPYRLALGLALARADRATEAEVYLAEVLRTDPTNGPANLAMARLARARNDVKTALVRYWKAIGGDWPAADKVTRIDGAFELVGLLDSTGNSRGAIAELLRLAGQTKDPAVLIRVAHGLLSHGSTRQAADLFQEILRDNPTSAPAFAGLGDAERADKDFQAAQHAYAQAARLDPDDASSRDKAAQFARVLALDPRARGIRILERYDRSRLILAGALQVFDECAPPSPSAELTAMIAKARRAVGPEYRARSFAEGADDNIRMALDVWASRRAGCVVPAERRGCRDRSWNAGKVAGRSPEPTLGPEPCAPSSPPLRSASPRAARSRCSRGPAR